jgi:hypothetical protein
MVLAHDKLLDDAGAIRPTIIGLAVVLSAMYLSVGG